ncbi:hypothetical protein HETIRDRAFT_449083 [Heterobasidion irregulare TC 32-1]|uniref:Uncharacterized protein n=1 Tax=Heterobasidion irregulare (strain TC 32-1) TaxID=747525 RepID=W4KMB3_HETIT|nr:uncharacterized protein HETIRDRAFT_449083 [Heterobasidion irregulare TC 32-1]ETW86201.1 hypothetical protein HETIRDRAFT_449083 [Heterobasidion irregulare TC 32-1]
MIIPSSLASAPLTQHPPTHPLGAPRPRPPPLPRASQHSPSCTASRCANAHGPSASSTGSRPLSRATPSAAHAPLSPTTNALICNNDNIAQPTSAHPHPRLYYVPASLNLRRRKQAKTTHRTRSHAA